MTLLDLAPGSDVVSGGGMIGLVAAAAFFFILAAAAYVAFKALKKTVKMAVRMAIVAVILLVAVVGSVSLWYFSSDSAAKSKPAANRRR